jgi:hypothetical protein
MATITFTVSCDWDPEAEVWYVSDSDVPGLSAEAPTHEEMAELLQRRVCELVQLNRPDLADKETRKPPVELLIQSREKLSITC